MLFFGVLSPLFSIARGIYKYIEFLLLMNSTTAAFQQTALILCLAVIVAATEIIMWPTKDSRAKRKNFLKCQYISTFSEYYQMHIFLFY